MPHLPKTAILSGLGFFSVHKILWTYWMFWGKGIFHFTNKNNSSNILLLILLEMIDALDAEMHFLDYKKYWKGWTEEMVKEIKGDYSEDFPELQEAYDKVLAYAREQGYFDQ